MTALAEHTHSPRTLLCHLMWLRDDSALAASMRGDEPRGWGADRHLLATVVDALQANTYVTAAVASKKKPRKPKFIERPSGQRKAKPRVVRVADIARGR